MEKYIETIIQNNIESAESIRKICLKLMQEDNLCKENDNYLYGRVLEENAKNKGVILPADMLALVKVFKQSEKPLGLLEYKTVLRQRQRLQEQYPSLQSNKVIKKALEEANREYYSTFL